VAPPPRQTEFPSDLKEISVERPYTGGDHMIEELLISAIEEVVRSEGEGQPRRSVGLRRAVFH
jgi:hypothetical protein